MSKIDKFVDKMPITNYTNVELKLLVIGDKYFMIKGLSKNKPILTWRLVVKKIFFGIWIKSTEIKKYILYKC